MGSLIARMLYDVVCPIVVASERDHAAIQTGDHVVIQADGSFTVDCRPASLAALCGRTRDLEASSTAYRRARSDPSSDRNGGRKTPPASPT